MTTLAIRLPDEELAALDELVAGERYPTRTAAVRAAIESLLEDERRREVDAAIREGYARHPAEPVDDYARSLAARSAAEEGW